MPGLGALCFSPSSIYKLDCESVVGWLATYNVEFDVFAFYVNCSYSLQRWNNYTKMTQMNWMHGWITDIVYVAG